MSSTRSATRSRCGTAPGQCLGRLLLAGALAGCASPPMPKVDDGQRVELVVIVSSAGGGGEIKIHNEALGEGAIGGTAAGMLAGALAGLSCGPFAVFCVPVGAVIYAVPGAVLGTAVGASGALPAEKAAALRERLASAEKSAGLQQALRSDVEKRARQHWTLGAEPTAWVLTLELQPLELVSTRDEQIGLMVRVKVGLRRPDTASAAAPKTFEYAAPQASLSVWLDEHSDFLESILAACTQQLATQIVAEAARH